jgi:threonine-phosphate decarboxylase
MAAVSSNEYVDLGSPMTITAHGGDVFGAARRLNVPFSQLTDFSASINPLGTSSRALRRLKQELELVRHYPDGAQQELRGLIAAREKIDPRCLLFGNGATQLLYLIPRCLRPVKALLLAPGFSEYLTALRHEGCQIFHHSLKSEHKFQLRLADLQQCIHKQHIDFVVLDNPHNPTGMLITRSALIELTEFCNSRGIYLLVDESFLDFTRQPSLSRLTSKRDHLIVVRSLTKFYALAGLRIGYMVASAPLIQNFAARVEPWSVNSLALIAAAESVRDLEYQKQALALVQRQRQFLSSELRRLGWLEPFPSQSNFLLVKIKHPDITSTQLRCELEKDRILIRDSAGFLGLDSQYIRLAVRTPKENRLLIMKLRRFANRYLDTNGERA